MFLRAWRRRESFEGRSTLRARLYRIATNACLDFLARRPDRVSVAPGHEGAPSEVRYLQPYPDRLLDEVTASGPDEPADAAVAKETIELAFIVAVQHLPPKQRATLILRDVLGWSARQAAAALDTTVPAANSALQRARATMRQQLPDRRLDWRASSKEELSRQERDLLQRYMEAHADGDPHALAKVLREDLRFAMPPEPAAGSAATPSCSRGSTAASGPTSWAGGGAASPGPTGSPRSPPTCDGRATPSSAPSPSTC